MKTWDYYKITPSRFAKPAQYDPATLVKTADACSLWYGKQPNVGWRFVVWCDGEFSQVGGIYPTKDELLNDMPRYAEQWGIA